MPPRSKPIIRPPGRCLVAALDETTLGLERLAVALDELVADLPERLAGGVEAGDEPLVGGQAFAVGLVAIGGGDALVAFDQLGQMLAHQPPSVLGEGVERVDLGQPRFEQGQLRPDRIGPLRRWRGQGGAPANQQGLELADHGSGRQLLVIGDSPGLRGPEGEEEENGERRQPDEEEPGDPDRADDQAEADRGDDEGGDRHAHGRGPARDRAGGAAVVTAAKARPRRRMSIEARGIFVEAGDRLLDAAGRARHARQPSIGLSSSEVLLLRPASRFCSTPSARAM
jgi:hypothetical protein